MKRTIGTEHQLKILNKIRNILEEECHDGVEQQMIIELLLLSHVNRMEEDWEFCADSINKHVKQLYREIA